MPSAAVESTLDVALWFLDRARREDSYLQAQKLQRLLYLAQGHYAAGFYGRKLMPATFVAHELGPIEPTIFRLFELGPPNVPQIPPPAEVENFLDSVWRRFAHLSTDHLNETVRRQEVYRKALARGPGEEISVDEMAAFFRRKEEPAPTLRTSDGRTVTKWIPPTKAAPRKAR